VWVYYNIILPTQCAHRSISVFALKIIIVHEMHNIVRNMTLHDVYCGINIKFIFNGIILYKTILGYTFYIQVAI